MQIRFISGLTAEEENDLAPALLRAVTALLDRFPLVYTLRIETSGNQVYQHCKPASTETEPAPNRRADPSPASAPFGSRSEAATVGYRSNPGIALKN